MEELMTQHAPYPVVLDDIVKTYTYRPGWRFVLDYKVRDQSEQGDSAGLTLDIITHGYNSYHRPTQPSAEFGPGEFCADCGQPFPCEGYKSWDGDDAPRLPYQVHHYKPVPPATYNWGSWMRWLFDMCVEVDLHEAMEMATVVIDGVPIKPFAPNHGPGNNPYVVREFSTELERRTKFTGEVNNDT